MSTSTERIRALNDQLRANGQGGNVLMTSGIRLLPEPVLATVVAAVQDFSQFTPDNDPYGEHDFGMFEIAAFKVMFKIDYYDEAMEGHSRDAGNPEITNRVLTIMLASEY